ncbi:hypothetical protein [Oscillatoria acuminata]|nr:hypothetical protein [Oscillatoria acuminata]
MPRIPESLKSGFEFPEARGDRTQFSSCPEGVQTLLHPGNILQIKK